MIEDPGLRKSLIDASVKMEELIKAGTFALDKKIESRTEWGLLIIGSMERPREDKPIIFKYGYRIERAKFKAWIDEHKYLLDGHLGFQSRGLTVMVTGPGVNKYDKTSFSITVRQSEEIDEDVDAALDLLNQTVEFVVHREIVNDHDWVVQADLE